MAISFTTFIFLPMESTNTKLVSGKRIANGMPGNPPPVPTSKTSVPGLKAITLAIPRECKICRSYKSSMSFLEITLICSFHS